MERKGERKPREGKLTHSGNLHNARQLPGSLLPLWGKVLAVPAPPDPFKPTKRTQQQKYNKSETLE